MTAHDLARRAVACKHWRWMPGMLPLNGTGFSYRILRVRKDGTPVTAGMHATWPLFDALPDLADPATLGCLLALVREAWGDPHAYCAPRRASIIGGFLCGPGWYVWVAPEFLKGGEYWPSPTEVEALVAALEAAP